MKHELSFTFFIRVGEDRFSQEIQSNKKNSLIDLIEKIDDIHHHEVENDGEDWCINCIANIDAESFGDADGKLTSHLKDIPFFWDYKYIRNLKNGLYYEP